MSWRDDINIALNNLKKIVDVPEERESEVRKIMEKVWAAARDYDVRWDSD